MNKRFINLLGILCACPTLLVAQDVEDTTNMVLNPSFEEYEKCPESTIDDDKTHRLIPHWTYPSATTPDYFNKCGKDIVKVPDNFAGYSYPHSGNGYMGSLLTGSSAGSRLEWREYIQGELKKPMKAGVVYCVSFWYKLANRSMFAVDQMSVYFTEQKIANGNETSLNYTPQLNNESGLFLDNTDEWKHYCMLYTAAGNESFFIVGNFKNYDNTNYVVTGKNSQSKTGKSYAYYFFDDFEIRPLTDCEVCACVPKGLETVIVDSVYTGGLDPVTGKIQRIIDDGVISLGISGGTPPYKVEWSNGATGQKLTNLPAGTYTYNVSDQNNCHNSGKVVFVQPEIPEDPFTDGLRNIEEGSALILNNIFFETGKSTLLPQSNAELDKIAEFLAEGTVSQIEISGHTDNVGSDELNLKLSQARAQAVVNYLVSKGINANMLQAKGYGKTRPIDTNLTEQGKSNNRRVEFFVLKK